MTKGLIRSISRGPKTQAPVIRQRFAIKDAAITVDGATGVGFGTAVLADLPEGNILLLGAIAYLQFDASAESSGIIASFDGDYSIGSAPTADASLAGGEVDVIPSTALGAATSKVSPRARGANATQVMLDNTDGSLELNLNLLIDDASISADGIDFVVNGILDLAYIVLGDD